MYYVCIFLALETLSLPRLSSLLRLSRLFETLKTIETLARTLNVLLVAVCPRLSRSSRRAVVRIQGTCFCFLSVGFEECDREEAREERSRFVPGYS